MTLLHPPHISPNPTTPKDNRPYFSSCSSPPHSSSTQHWSALSSKNFTQIQQDPRIRSIKSSSVFNGKPAGPYQPLNIISLCGLAIFSAKPNGPYPTDHISRWGSSSRKTSLQVARNLSASFGFFSACIFQKARLLHTWWSFWWIKRFSVG